MRGKPDKEDESARLAMTHVLLIDLVGRACLSRIRAGAWEHSNTSSAVDPTTWAETGGELVSHPAGDGPGRFDVYWTALIRPHIADSLPRGATAVVASECSSSHSYSSASS